MVVRENGKLIGYVEEFEYTQISADGVRGWATKETAYRALGPNRGLVKECVCKQAAVDVLRETFGG